MRKLLSVICIMLITLGWLLPREALAFVWPEEWKLMQLRCEPGGIPNVVINTVRIFYDDDTTYYINNNVIGTATFSARHSNNNQVQITYQPSSIAQPCIKGFSVKPGSGDGIILDAGYLIYRTTDTDCYIISEFTSKIIINNTGANIIVESRGDTHIEYAYQRCCDEVERLHKFIIPECNQNYTDSAKSNPDQAWVQATRSYSLPDLNNDGYYDIFLNTAIPTYGDFPLGLSDNVPRGTSAMRGMVIVDTSDPTFPREIVEVDGMDEVKQAATDAQAQAAAAASAAASASASAQASVNLLVPPLINQFKINNGALETSNNTVQIDITACNSVVATGCDKILYRVVRINKDGKQTRLRPTGPGLLEFKDADGNYSNHQEIKDIPVIAGANNLLLTVGNRETGAISTARAMIIAGTADERKAALKDYYGGMYDAVTSSQSASEKASNISTEIGNQTYGLNALKNLINTVNGVAGEAKTAAEDAKNSAAAASKAVQSGSTTAIDVLTDTNKGLIATADAVKSGSNTAIGVLTDETKGLIQTYNKADTAANKASTAVTQLTDGATDGTIRKDLTLTKANTVAIDDKNGNVPKSAAQLAKEARDKITEITQTITPVIHSVKGKNGATCTTKNSFTVVISASNAVKYRAKSPTGGWTGWGDNNVIDVSGLSSGANTIEVQAISSVDGTPATGSITIFKI